VGNEMVIVPSNGDGYLELARTRQGRLFKKHLLSKGRLVHPDVGVVDIDDTFIAKLKKNFDDRVCDIVQVPLANKNNQHSEEPDRNIGEVVDLRVEGDKVFAIVDVRDPQHADRMGKTYLGASAMLALDYTNTKTQQKVGPTLLHSCVTNRPYVTGLDDYEEILAATTDRSGEAAVLLSEPTIVVEKPAEETEMPEEKTETVAEPSLEDILATLKSKHNIDVSALQAQTAETTRQTELSNTIVEALTKAGIVKLSNTDDEKPSTDTVITAVQELATNNVTLTNRLTTLEKRDAEHIVDGFISEGRILPAERDVRVELKLTHPDLFDKLLPAQPIVKLSNELGKNAPKDEDHKVDIDAEITRYAEMAAARR
jgi:Mu-like prophage I protein